MTYYYVEGSTSIVGTKATDTYIVDPLRLLSAAITDPGGTHDSLWINMRKDISWDAEFGTVAGKLVWRDMAGHQVLFDLNIDGTAPIELYQKTYLPEFGYTNGRTVAERVILAGQTLTDTNITYTGVAVLGTEGNDSITAPAVTGFPTQSNSGNCEIFGNQGNDTLTGSGDARFLLHGGRGSDVLSGVGTMDVDLYGGLGNDTLTGAGGGFDDLEGGKGNDKIDGGAGSDYIWGGSGWDTLTGGTGPDNFYFGVLDSGRDRITDYDKVDDILIFEDLTAADLTITQVGANTVVDISTGARVTVLHTLVADLHYDFY